MKRPFLPILYYLRRYPFLSYSKIFELDEYELSDLSSAKKRVKDVLNGNLKFQYDNIEFLCNSCSEKCNDLESCTYPIRSVEYLRILKYARESVLEWNRCISLVSSLDDSSKRKFIVRIARIFRNMLKKECDEFLFIVAEDLGIRFEGFSVDFRDYLKCSLKIRSKDWKLVNRKVVRGFVQLSREEFIRLIEEFIKERLREKISLGMDISLESLPIDVRCFPECMKKILSDLRSGKNVPHVGRFAIASFLINLGFNIDRIVEVFKSAPDFDEDKTRYQVEHIAGMRGKREKYLTPKCETMRSWGLCNWECNFDNPIKFYRGCLNGGYKGKRTSKRKSNTQNYFRDNEG